MKQISIKAARANSNLSQTQLAEKVGVSRDSIKNYENGKIIPNVDVAFRIAEVLGFDVHEIKFF